MSNNSFERAFDMLLKEAAVEASERICGELKEPEERIEFSKEHERRMEKLFRQAEKGYRRKRLRQRAVRCACVLLAACIVASVGLFSVDAWRVRFLNFVIDIGKPNTDYNFGNNSGSYSDDNVSIECVPRGFNIVKNEYNGNGIFLKFEKNRLYFSVEIKGMNGEFNLDTEEAKDDNLKINGNEAVYVVKDDLKSFIWSDDRYSYAIYGNLTKNELQMIAESIKMLKN